MLLKVKGYRNRKNFAKYKDFGNGNNLQTNVIKIKMYVIKIKTQQCQILYIMLSDNAKNV